MLMAGKSVEGAAVAAQAKVSLDIMGDPSCFEQGGPQVKQVVEKSNDGPELTTGPANERLPPQTLVTSAPTAVGSLRHLFVPRPRSVAIDHQQSHLPVTSLSQLGEGHDA
jgi:hypothetical protein